MRNKENKNDKMSLKEKLKDKRERAKIELIIYGIFFVGVIIFARVLDSTSSSNIQVENKVDSFVYSVLDNYEYDMILTIDNDEYHYYGRVLGNNSKINLEIDSIVKSYYYMNKKYYILENDNYILTNVEDIYPYIDYRYLDINVIKEYLKLAVKNNNTYKVKIKDIMLNSQSEEYITINVEEGDKNIVIDYSNLFKLTNKNNEKVIVNVTYSNIGNIISLEE